MNIFKLLSEHRHFGICAICLTSKEVDAVHSATIIADPESNSGYSVLFHCYRSTEFANNHLFFGDVTLPVFKRHNQELHLTVGKELTFDEIWNLNIIKIYSLGRNYICITI